LGSARVSRVGERVLAIADFFLEFSFLPIDQYSKKVRFGEPPNPRPERVRYPDEELIRFIRDWRLLFQCGRLGEFLETRIIPERVEHRIEAEERRSEWHVLSQRAIVRYREQFL